MAMEGNGKCGKAGNACPVNFLVRHSLITHVFGFTGIAEASSGVLVGLVNGVRVNRSALCANAVVTA